MRKKKEEEKEEKQQQGQRRRRRRKKRKKVVQIGQLRRITHKAPARGASCNGFSFPAVAVRSWCVQDGRGGSNA